MNGDSPNTEQSRACQIARRDRRRQRMTIMARDPTVSLYGAWAHLHPQVIVQPPDPENLCTSTRLWKYHVRRYRQQLNEFQRVLFSTPVPF